MKTENSMILKGIGASGGIAIGKAYLFDQMETQASYYKLDDLAHVTREIKRLRDAIDVSKQQIEEIKSKLAGFEVKDPIYILGVHLMMLDDESFVERTIKNIKEQSVNAEWAVSMTVDSYQEIFSKLDDDYIRGRVSDVQVVGQRIIKNLSGAKANTESLPRTNSPVIFVARDISPADTAQMKLDNVQGFLTDVGSRTSHTTIVACSLEIPAVVGMENVTKVLRTNDDVIIDGTAGIVIVNPDAETRRRYEAKQHDYFLARKELLTDAHLPAITKDGYRTTISCNIEFVEEIPSAIQYGAESIGLYRTEFLYINRKKLASEEEHIANYKSVLGIDSLQWATIRTFDLGGDKFFTNSEKTKEMNPQMGLRAIRFCLKEKDIFRMQLRAIVCAAQYGKIKILFPMISGIEEIREAKNIYNDVRRELIDEGRSISDDIELGVMIEVPSAVIIAEELAKEVDFFSIGTNDLIQYALAIDRVNENVTYLYEPLHPAILRLIKMVTEVGHKAGIKVAMCGEMAGDPINTLILLALRIDELSMYPLAIPRIKRIIRAATIKEADALLNEVLLLPTAKEIKECVTNYMYDKFGDEIVKE
ncbi:MAG: phosphoenolpyruvate--protein phosphotransferase [Deltaproteobacteria bacterium]